MKTKDLIANGFEITYQNLHLCIIRLYTGMLLISIILYLFLNLMLSC